MPHTHRSRLILRFLLAVIVIGLSLSVKPAAAGILFEGWSKVLISGKHVGYVVQRFDFDEKKKEFRSTHFLKTNADSGGLTESLVARADASFKPLGYQYTTLVMDKPTLIDATFKGEKMTAIVTEGKTKKTVTNNIPKGTFLSAFLGYVMLQSKDGLKKGVKYEYQGIIEESALVAKGEAYIAEEETVSGIPSFRVLNTINGSKFISLVTHKAEILGTVSPSVGVQTILVPTMEEAIAGFGINTAALTRLFGSMPKGKENEISRRSLMPAPKVPPAPAAGPAAATKPETKLDAKPAAPPVNAPVTGTITSPSVTTPPPATAPPAPPATGK